MLKGDVSGISQLLSPNKEFKKNQPVQVSLSMKYSPAGNSEMTEVHNFVQRIDEVANCSKPQTHMVCPIYSLGTAMACGEFSNILSLYRLYTFGLSLAKLFC